jgi:LysR family transcriptional regulator, nitrogen assimilation regulatory protein
MDIRILKYFLAVAEEGSFSKAALRLRVAQPALSQHVRKLEKELGCELLHRTPRGVSLTESGRQLLLDAKDILARLDAVQERLRGFGTTPVGHVNLAMSQSVAKVLAIPLYKAMQQRLPRVALRLMESNTGYMPQMLRRREIDLAIVFREQRDPGIDHVVMLSEELHLVGPPGEERAAIPFAEAAALPLFLPARPHSVRELINDYARRCGVSLNVVAEVDGIPQLRDFAAAGLGLTMLTPASVLEEVAAGRVSMRAIADPAIRRPVILCHASDTALSRAASAVKALTVEVAQALVREGVWPGYLPADPSHNETD